MAIFHLLPVVSVSRQLPNSSTKNKLRQRNEMSYYETYTLFGCNDSFTWYSSIGMPPIPSGEKALQEIARFQEQTSKK